MCRIYWTHWRYFILSWAIKEIDPLHPDVPDIILERRERAEVIRTGSY
jgi:hypothetical protein